MNVGQLKHLLERFDDNLEVFACKPRSEKAMGILYVSTIPYSPLQDMQMLESTLAGVLLGLG